MVRSNLFVAVLQVHIFCGFVSIVVQRNSSSGEGGWDITDNWLWEFHSRKLCSVCWAFGYNFFQHQCHFWRPKSQACSGSFPWPVFSCWSLDELISNHELFVWFVDSAQVWARGDRHSTANRLASDTRRCWVFGAEDWPGTLQRVAHLCPRHCFLCCQVHLQPTPIEVLHLKHQCRIVVANHIPRSGTSNFQRRQWQCVCAHQGRQLPLDSLIYLYVFVCIMYMFSNFYISINSSIGLCTISSLQHFFDEPCIYITIVMNVLPCNFGT